MVEAGRSSARFSLRCSPADAETRLGLTIELQRSTERGRAHLARIGPDAWLVRAAADDGELVARSIEQALAGSVFSLVDISDRDLVIRVGGAHAGAIVNSACPLDLRDGAFPPGAVTQTVLGKAAIVLLRLADGTYEIECWRSFAPYVREMLDDAARSLQALESGTTLLRIP